MKYMSYICGRCHKQFVKRASYESHQARIRPCITITIPIIPSQPVISSTVTIVKPILKWVGGKTQILEEILRRFPSMIHHYHEPFLGGGSVLLGLLSYRQAGKIAISGTVYASDLNSNLIGLYQNIQNEPDTLITEVHQLIEEFTRCRDTEIDRSPTCLDRALTSHESYYYWIRSRFNALSKEQRMTSQGSAMLLFLNKNCFRGVYREGPRGFNVPYGNYKNHGMIDDDHIRTVSQLIQGVVFRVQPFIDSLASVQPGDVIYLDPPYAPETNTSFVSYTSDGFGIEQHRALFIRCQELRRCFWIMSNADVPLVRDSFPTPYSTSVLSCRRAIHSTKPDSKTNEVIIVNEP
jgi:DNA adenine methylase